MREIIKNTRFSLFQIFSHMAECGNLQNIFGRQSVREIIKNTRFSQFRIFSHMAECGNFTSNIR